MSDADISLDPLFHREYDEENYNCAHLFCDAWMSWTGDDVTDVLSGILKAPDDRRIDYKTRHYFAPTKTPVTPCMIEMQSKGQPPHVGFYHNGFVMQITQQGVQNQPLEISTRGFNEITFYRKR